MNIHALIVNTQIDTHSKQHLLSLLVNFIFISSLSKIFSIFKASAVYGQMVMNSEERWSSSVNCQQFAHHFVVEALGLQWPINLDIAGDVLPLSIDIGILLIPQTNKMTPRIR